MIAQNLQEYDVLTPKPLWAEQWPDVWADAAMASIKNTVAESGVNPRDIRGIAVSGLYGGSIMAGADFIAPYCNRMENLDVDFEETIADFRQMIDENQSSCKILAASFKNIRQVNRAFTVGAHAATVQPMLMHSSFEMAAVKKAVDDFKADWVAVRGDVSLTDL